jgi:hypothetical protein
VRFNPSIEVGLVEAPALIETDFRDAIAYDLLFEALPRQAALFRSVFHVHDALRNRQRISQVNSQGFCKPGHVNQFWGRFWANSGILDQSNRAQNRSVWHN